MAAVIFLLACVITSTAAQLGLPCMQKETIRDEITKCFSGLGKDNLINLDPTDKSGTMGQVAKLLGQENTCKYEDLTVDGLNCYMDFYGNCLNMRKMMPGRSEIKDAFSYACTHTREFLDPCLKGVTQNMMVCYMGKVKDRQIAILLGKAHMKSIEDETCSFMKEEMKCLKSALSKCSQTTSTVYYKFTEKLIPASCRYRDLRETLEHSSKLAHLLTSHMKPRGPR